MFREGARTGRNLCGAFNKLVGSFWGRCVERIGNMRGNYAVMPTRDIERVRNYESAGRVCWLAGIWHIIA